MSLMVPASDLFKAEAKAAAAQSRIAALEAEVGRLRGQLSELVEAIDGRENYDSGFYWQDCNYRKNCKCLKCRCRDLLKESTHAE